MVSEAKWYFTSDTIVSFEIQFPEVTWNFTSETIVSFKSSVQHQFLGICELDEHIWKPIMSLCWSYLLYMALYNFPDIAEYSTLE